MPRERERERDVLMNRTIMQYTKIENTRRKNHLKRNDDTIAIIMIVNSA